MVCKEEVFQWFKKLSAPKRIDVMCGLMNLCLPLELRFFGTCIENLGKRDFIYLREAEIRANNSEDVVRLSNLEDDVMRSKLIVTLALLHSTGEVACAEVIYNILTNSEWIKKLMSSPLDNKITGEVLLLFTMALNHPIFSFQQKTSLQAQFSMLVDLFEDISVVDEDQKEDWFYTYQNMPVQYFYTQAHVCDLELEGMQWKKAYRIAVTWSDGHISKVHKTHEEIRDFHHVLLQSSYDDSHPNDHVWNTSDQVFPDLELNDNETDDSAEEMVSAMADYLRQLVLFMNCNPKCCQHVTRFFGCRQVVAPNTAFYSFKSSHDVSEVNLAESSICGGNLSNLVSVSSSPIVSEANKLLNSSLTSQTSSLGEMPISVIPVSDQTLVPEITEFSLKNPDHAVPGVVNTSSYQLAGSSSPGPGSEIQSYKEAHNSATSASNYHTAAIQSNSFPTEVTLHSCSSASPHSSPVASIASSRCCSPNTTISTHVHNNCSEAHMKKLEMAAFEEQLCKERMRKYWEILKNFDISELKQMSDEEFKALKLTSSAMNKLRKILNSFALQNGVTFSQTRVVPEVNMDMQDNNPVSSSNFVHPSSAFTVANSDSSILGLGFPETGSQTFRYSTVPLDRSNCEHSDVSSAQVVQKSVCSNTNQRVSPKSTHTINNEPVLQTTSSCGSSKSTCSSSPVATKLKTVTNVANAKSNYLSHREIVNIDNSSSSSEYSSPPPSPGSDIFLPDAATLVSDMKIHEVPEGRDNKRRDVCQSTMSPGVSKNYSPLVTEISTSSNSHQSSTNVVGRESVVPIMTVPSPGQSIDMTQMPPPRPNIRPMTVHNVLYKSPPPVRVQLMTSSVRPPNSGTIIIENSNLSCGKNLPSALTLHPPPDSAPLANCSQYQVRFQGPVCNDHNQILKPPDGQELVGSLPSSSQSYSSNVLCPNSLPFSSVSTSIANITSKVKTVSIGSKIPHNFSKPPPLISREQDNKDLPHSITSYMQLPPTSSAVTTSYVITCTASIVHPAVPSNKNSSRCLHNTCRCNCSNSSPPPVQHSNSVPANQMSAFVPGFMPPRLYPFSPSHGFIPPHTNANGFISTNMPAAFAFAGNPTPLPTDVNVHDQIRYTRGQGSFSSIPQQIQPVTPSNKPPTSHLVGGGAPPQFIAYQSGCNVSMPIHCGLPSGKPMSCYNCGNQGHQGSACKETTMEEITRNGQFRLNFAPNPKDSPGD